MFKSFFKKFNENAGEKPLRDPVCGMRATDGITSVYKDQTHTFCSDHCKQRFEKDPEAYIAK